MNVVVGAGPLGLAVARALVSLNRPVRVVCLMTTREIATLTFLTTGMPLRISAAPTWAVALIASVNPLMRAVKEQLYQFERPFVVDHSKFAQAFGASATPHEAAIARTLEWYRTAGHEKR